MTASITRMAEQLSRAHKHIAELTTQLEESVAVCKEQRAQLAEAKIACPCAALNGETGK